MKILMALVILTMAFAEGVQAAPTQIDDTTNVYLKGFGKFTSQIPKGSKVIGFNRSSWGYSRGDKFEETHEKGEVFFTTPFNTVHYLLIYKDLIGEIDYQESGKTGWVVLNFDSGEMTALLKKTTSGMRSIRINDRKQYNNFIPENNAIVKTRALKRVETMGIALGIGDFLENRKISGVSIVNIDVRGAKSIMGTTTSIDDFSNMSYQVGVILKSQSNTYSVIQFILDSNFRYDDWRSIVRIAPISTDGSFTNQANELLNSK